MPTWLKVMLAVVGSGVLLLVCAVLGLAGYMRSHRAEYAEEGRQAMSAGMAYGRTQARDSRDCIEEGLRRLPGLQGIRAEVANNVFCSACLQVAPRAPAFCDGVPAESALLDSVRWRSDVCAAHPGLDLQLCQRFLGAWQKNCASRR